MLDLRLNTVTCSDALTWLQSLPSASVHCIVTSPPYFGLRDYGVAGQLGLEDTPEAYVARLVGIFREARRVLRDDGTLWLNLGDSYASSPRGNKDVENFTRARQNGGLGWTPEHAKRGLADYRYDKQKASGLPPKNLLGIPWRVALALQADGWILRNDLIWNKPNPTPESMRDRFTRSHEYVFLFAKQGRYYFDQDAVRQPIKKSTIARLKRAVSKDNKVVSGAPGQRPHTMHQPREHGEGYPINEKGANRRTVWTVSTASYKGAHYAVFPEALIRPLITVSCPKGGVVLDMFGGSGTVGVVAKHLERNYLLCDLSQEYVEMARQRIADSGPVQRGLDF